MYLLRGALALVVVFWVALTGVFVQSLFIEAANAGQVPPETPLFYGILTLGLMIGAIAWCFGDGIRAIVADFKARRREADHDRS